MHSQQLLNQIKNHLYADPQKCIKILSNKSFINNLFHQHLVQLTQILQNALNKNNKQNKGLSFNAPSSINNQNHIKKNQQLNAQLIVCIYSIIIMKSTAKSVIAAQEQPIFNAKLANQTLSKIHKQLKRQDVRKIVAALLLKIPNFNNHKTIVKDISPQFISFKTMEKASSAFRNQCPNLFQEKLLSHKNSQWGQFLVYKPFKLDTYSQIFKKLISVGTNSSDANTLIQIRDELKKEYQYLMNRIQVINKEEVFIYEFCQKFTDLYRTKLQFSKLLQGQKYSNDSKNNKTSKTLPSYNINQLRLKILLEGKNHLLIILNSLIKKLSSYWTRKLKWLYDFIIQRIQIYGLQELGLSSIQQPDVYIEKLNQLKLLIKLSHTYYKVFGDGLFPQEKLKGILFTQQFSFYKLIQAILYNEYQFIYQSENSRIVNYQKSKKVSEQTKNKKNLIKTINVNSKSLNINPHYDLVFQKVIYQNTYKNGDSYSNLRQLIQEALKFIKTYYKKSETYFYGGNLITMIQNCKNSQILKQRILQNVKQIKATLYPSKKMTKQGLQFFCQEIFQGYISKKRNLQESQLQNRSNLNICKTTFLTIQQCAPNQAYQQNLYLSKLEQSEDKQKIIRKTKSYDMVIEGWNNEEQGQQRFNSQFKTRNPELKDKDIFYSIKQCSVNEETDKNNKKEQKVDSFKEQQAQAGEQFILTPEF